MDLKTIFTEIYNNNIWKGKESRSGLGSDSKQTETLKKAMVSLINEYEFTSMVDVGCGDFHWQKEFIDETKIKYLGLDIVETLILDNNLRHANENIKFKVGDITTDSLPRTELVLCRDVLVHLSFSNIREFLNLFLNSGSEYLLMTTFINPNRINQNFIEQVKMWKTRNFENRPFNFVRPEYLIWETVESPNFSDKRLGLWHRSDLVKQEFLKC